MRDKFHYKLLPPGKRGASWYIRGAYRGERFEVSARTKDRDRAESFAREYALGVVRDSILGTPEAPLTFTQAAAAYLAFRDPGPLDKTWLARLSEWFGARAIGEIRHAHLIEAANELQPGRSAGTRNRHVIGPTSAVLHYAAEQGWCEYRRFRRFPEARRSPRRPATDETMAKLIAATVGHRRLMLALLYETGLRLGDVMALDEESVDLPGAALLTRVGKTDERIRIPLSPAIVALIANLPRCRGNRLFPWSSRWSVYRWLKPLCKRLGVHYTPHLSRHALATDLLRRGVPDKQAAEYGAWRDPRSLHRYQHAQPKALEGRSINDLLRESPHNAPKKRQNPAA